MLRFDNGGRRQGSRRSSFRIRCEPGCRECEGIRAKACCESLLRSCLLCLIVRAKTSKSSRRQGVPLGLFCRTDFKVVELQVRRRSSLVVYSDGITESRDAAGIEYGLNRLGSVSGNQCRVLLQALQTESMTGTSTRTPTTVASAAPEPGPNRAIAVATASSKKLLAPISAPGAATECSTFSQRIRP